MASGPGPSLLRRLGRQAGLLPGRMLVGLVQLYRLAVSPVLAPTCRYWPSCSEYAIEALRRHGAAKGSWLTAARLCRCHPWSVGGVDEVPACKPGRHATSTISNTRWRAYLGDPQRDTSDSSSS
jgi:putative membrane protein insertion efficiency factor